MYISKHASDVSAAFAKGDMREFYKCKKRLTLNGCRSSSYVISSDGYLCVTFEEIKFAFFDQFGRMANGQIASPEKVVATFRPLSQVDPLYSDNGVIASGLGELPIQMQEIYSSW